MPAKKPPFVSKNVERGPKPSMQMGAANNAAFEARGKARNASKNVQRGPVPAIQAGQAREAAMMAKGKARNVAAKTASRAGRKKAV